MANFTYLLKSLEPFFLFLFLGYITIEVLKFQNEIEKKKK